MKTSFVQAGPIRLQYFERGEGPEVILFFHGIAGSGRAWDLVQKELDPSRFRTIAFSSRGAGDSDHPSLESDYTIESFANDLFAAVESLGLANFTLVGHSLGGAISTRFALEHQDRLKAFVLLDPATLEGRGQVEGWEDLVLQVYRNRIQRFGLDNQEIDMPQAFREALQADMAHCSLERFRGSSRSLTGIQLRKRLGEMRIPTLVVAGDQDKIVPIQSILTEFLSLPPENRSLHVFHGVGHAPNVEVPKQLAKLLDQFVTRTVNSTI